MTSVKSTWPEVLHGVESELTHVETMARRVDKALASILVARGTLTQDQTAVFQEMDILIQTVEDLRNFAAHLKENIPEHQAFDITSALKVLRLDRVRDNLSQVKRDNLSDEGRVTLF
ncbi:hypothetical protein SAMN04488040_1078 [Sulfitobacter marinus]|uniref:Uncharacterized protein n=1 Tax=Sulfitobacter marinus TaxID=394264 RepID=A0A1I6QYF2_9RHOB|nr:hypothetical protein [Sulfitobacter marinus]SFS57541.1 hypothetical protein SAMN04488040_1078 [Sulfitobacter marinus]